MNTMKEKYMGESSLTGRPNDKLGFVIKDGAVSTQKIANKAVTLEKIADEASDYFVEQAVQESKAIVDEQTQCIKKNIKELWEGLDKLDKKTTKREKELQNQINTQGDIITQLRNQISNDHQTLQFNAAFHALDDKIDAIAAKQPQTVPVQWPNLIGVNATPYIGQGYYPGGAYFPNYGAWGNGGVVL